MTIGGAVVATVDDVNKALFGLYFGCGSVAPIGGPIGAMVGGVVPPIYGGHPAPTTQNLPAVFPNGANTVYTPPYPYSGELQFGPGNPMQGEEMQRRPGGGEVYPGVPKEVLRPLGLDSVIHIENDGPSDIWLCTTKRFGREDARLTLHPGDAITRLLVAGEGLWVMAVEEHGWYRTSFPPVSAIRGKYKRFPGSEPKPTTLPESGRVKRKEFGA